MEKSPQYIGALVGAFLIGLLAATLLIILTVPRLFYLGEGRVSSFSGITTKARETVVTIYAAGAAGHIPAGGSKPMLLTERRSSEALSPFSAAVPQRQDVLGAGLIISESGYILTNFHVLGEVKQVLIVTYSGERLLGQLVGSDPDSDLALLKVAAKAPLPSAILGDSDTVKEGDWVIAIGGPLGFEHSITVGVISAKGRAIGMGLYDDFLQTDAFMYKGSSGGPLLDTAGKVIGINTALLSEGKGVNFAIPINIAKKVAAELITKGRVIRGWLGVVISDISSNTLPAQRGILVVDVFEGSPAAAAGIQQGDLIVGVEDKIFNNSRELLLFVADWGVDKNLKVSLLRAGQPLLLEVLISEKKSTPLTAKPNIPTANPQF